MRYRMLCKVIRVEERFRQHLIGGHGESAVFTDESLGWFVILSGNLAMRLGHEKPDMTAGQTVDLILETIE